MLTGTNLQYANSYNIRIVLEAIRLYSPISRMEIARRTQLTAQTVTNITKKLLKLGLILESERLQEGRGAPSIMLKLNKDAAFSIGLDFDKDHLTGVLMDLNGVIRQRESIAVDFPKPEEAMKMMTSIAQALIDREKIDKKLVWGVGVGLPGPLVVSKGSVVSNVANPQLFPGWNHVPVTQILGERLKLPIFLENNANASAIGERWYGDGQHIKTFFYVYFGAGLGGGLFLNGQLYSGFSGNAGEIGYLPSSGSQPMVDHSSQPNDSAQSHVGMHFNLPLLFRRLNAAGLEVKSGEDLLHYFEIEHPLVMEWIEKAIEELIPPVLSIEYLIDPEVIFFGGRIPDPILQYFLLGINEKLPASRIQGKPVTPLLKKAKSGQDAAALGVATIPLYHSFAPLPGVLMKNEENGGVQELKTLIS